MNKKSPCLPLSSLPRCLPPTPSAYGVGGGLEGVNLVEVEISVCVSGSSVQLFGIRQIFSRSWQAMGVVSSHLFTATREQIKSDKQRYIPAKDGSNSSQFCGGQEDVSTFTQTVGEVTSRGRNNLINWFCL